MAQLLVESTALPSTQTGPVLGGPGTARRVVPTLECSNHVTPLWNHSCSASVQDACRLSANNRASALVPLNDLREFQSCVRQSRGFKLQAGGARTWRYGASFTRTMSIRSICNAKFISVVRNMFELLTNV